MLKTEDHCEGDSEAKRSDFSSVALVDVGEALGPEMPAFVTGGRVS